MARAIFQAEQQRSVIEKSRQDSLKSLLKIIDRWSESRKVGDFFDDIIARSANLTERERSEILAKVKDARELIASLIVLKLSGYGICPHRCQPIRQHGFQAIPWKPMWKPLF